MIVLQILPALDSGGVELGTVQIAEALVKAGHTALVASSGGRMVAEVEAVGGRHITLPLKSKNPLTMLANIDRLGKVIRANGVQLVHARSRAPAWSARFAAQRAGVPFVTTFHAAYKHGFALKRFYNAVMTSGERVIAISEFIRQHVTDVYGVEEARITLIHRGADMKRFDPAQVDPARLAALRDAWQLPPNVPVIMCVGRLSRTKGQDVLIKALGRIKQLPFHCVLVGSDQGRTSVSDDLKQLVTENGLEGRVALVGDCRDMPAAYLLSSVVVAPSLLPEAFGRVLVEPQAMERLIISSNSGAAPESVVPGKTGWLVEPGNPEALAAALRDFLTLSQNERRSRERAARSHVLERFDTALMCSKTLTLYDDVLSGGVS